MLAREIRSEFSSMPDDFKQTICFPDVLINIAIHPQAMMLGMVLDFTLSGNDLLDHPSLFDPGKFDFKAVKSVSKFFVINSEQMQNRCV